MDRENTRKINFLNSFIDDFTNFVSFANLYEFNLTPFILIS